MNIINSEYELIDVENQIVILVYKVDDVVVAKYIYDFANPENDKTEGTFVDYVRSQGIEWEEEKAQRFHEVKREEAKYYLEVYSK
ncbi:hypothetical protein [Bacillus sp. Cr_A10]|uniref:hypothetical protein n=1 Tax=Bacillus sp. Cr_A10 TaxID=3033993 RepID=UPI0023DBA6EA|nr:hypothetical protein [Bacillus sp. Cr_A10]MDF2065085.1 hypothetical protein [Bacillus sp. Cr_A10]